MTFFNIFGSETRSFSQPSSEIVAGHDWGWPSISGETIDLNAALNCAPLAAGVAFIADQISSLPLHVYAVSEDGDKKKAKDDRLYSALQRNVNSDGLTRQRWLHSVTQEYLVHGRSFTRILRDTFDNPIELLPLKQSSIRAQFLKSEDGKERLVYRDITKRKLTYYEASEVLDFVRMPNGPLEHHIPWQMHADSIAIYRAIEKFSATSLSSPILQLIQTGSSEKFMSPETAEKRSKEFSSILSRARQAGQRILPILDQRKIEPIGWKPEELQIVEAKKQAIIDITRMLNLPPVFMNSLENSTYTNSEQQSLTLEKFCLSPIVCCFQAELNAKLTKTKSREIEFDLDGLLRGDQKSRYEALRIAITTGFMTIDEARAKLNLSAQGGNADKLLLQLNIAPIDDLGRGDNNDETL
jgi:HK97 family phage portal protein